MTPGSDMVLTDTRRRSLEELVGKWARLHPPPLLPPPPIEPDPELLRIFEVTPRARRGEAADADEERARPEEAGTGGTAGAGAGAGEAGAGVGEAGAGAGEEPPPDGVSVGQVEVLRRDRPSLLSVLATVDGRTAHAVLGIRQPGDTPHFLRPGEEAVLGLLDDDIGLGVVLDAVADSELAMKLIEVIAGHDGSGAGAPVVSEDEGTIVVTLPDHIMTIFSWPTDGPHPGVELMVALDDAGFNHLPTPVALWRRGGRDLGVLQERPPGSVDGWAVALTSLRDLYARGGRPDEAGGDFGPEAHAIGVMAARMHLALDRAFGRTTGAASEWMDNIVRNVQAADPALATEAVIVQAIYELRAANLRLPMLRTHGDFNLGRTARSDVGWVVADVLPGGRPPGSLVPVLRCPLADVSDMLWSLHHVASVAATERDPGGREGIEELARQWETRNRRAFLNGYLSTPGIGGLVPTDRRVVRNLARVFEVERAAARLRQQQLVAGRSGGGAEVDVD